MLFFFGYSGARNSELSPVDSGVKSNWRYLEAIFGRIWARITCAWIAGEIQISVFFHAREAYHED